MAEMEKKLSGDPGENSVRGYVHSVSPLKTSSRSNVTFFNCIIQTDCKTFADVVNFSPEKRQLFLQAQDTKKAVMLKNVSRALSFTSQSGYSLKCNKNTQLDTANVNFEFCEPSTQEVKDESVASSLTKSVSTNVNVRCKVIEIEDQRTITTKSGTSILLANANVSDKTDTCRLSLWDSHIQSVASGQCYFFRNVAVKEFDGVKYLTTTSKTTISSITDLGEVKQVQSQEIVIIGNPATVLIQINKTCQNCKVKIPDDQQTGTSVKCQNCQMRQKTTATPVFYTMKLKLENNPTMFNVVNDVAKIFFVSLGKESENNTDVLEELMFSLTIELKLPSKFSSTPTKLSIVTASKSTSPDESPKSLEHEASLHRKRSSSSQHPNNQTKRSTTHKKVKEM